MLKESIIVERNQNHTVQIFGIDLIWLNEDGKYSLVCYFLGTGYKIIGEVQSFSIT